MSLLSRLAVQAARAYGILSSRSTNVSADYLVVAGGGGGGGGNGVVSAGGGGGGAGGYKTNSVTLSTLNTYSIVVGAGGNGGTGAATGNGSAGSNSSFSGTGITTITSTGGGYGSNIIGGAGGNGGSGGGAGGSSTFVSGGTGTSGQGNNGGSSGAGSPNYGAGGGGGASAVGVNGTGSVGGNGGAGTASSISGSSVTYAGGGGGGMYNGGTAGTGGAGGGANGATSGSATSNATANTGGGGGGSGSTASNVNYSGSAGGSGIVIISYTSATPKFVGGTITTSGGKQIHTFTSSGTLSPITPITASYLVVAGGGAGGSGTNWGCGGGGAGGLLTNSTTLYSGATYVVTVGAGGAKASNAIGGNGGNSSLSGTGLTTITSVGGGGGGAAAGSSLTAGASGGSGGGGQGIASSGGTGGAGTAGQGYAGGGGADGITLYTAGGGGGGAGAVGETAQGLGTKNGGAGGVGVTSSISGTSTYYAGGGGGGVNSGGGTAGGAGGSGGGGTGAAQNSSTYSIAGTSSTGGGGGGGAASTYSSGSNGGSGIVIISYAGSQVFNGGLVTTSGGNTIHTFTSTGALTPLTNNLNNSLRFRSSASAYLNRTPTVAGNRRTWTWSGWVKRGALGISGTVVTSRQNGQTDWLTTAFTSSDTLQVCRSNGGTYNLVTTQVFRDPSAWYHIVIAWDTTQATAANRVKLYVNGNQVTAFGTANYPAQNYDGYFNTAVEHEMGAVWAVSSVTDYFDGYMTDINFIDGQALEPYYFGNNDANGVWKPIQYKGTYGTNGFYLTFGNTTSTTTLGYDSSPNGNNWTCNNISLTAGTTYDAMTDVPTLTSATVANYCTLNPIATNTVGVGTLSNANLNFSIPNTYTVYGTMSASSGKYYWEAVATSSPIGIGIKQVNVLDRYSNTIYYMGSSLSAGEKYVNGTGSAYGASWTTGDVIGVAVDMDGGTVTFYKNNTSQGSIALSLATITEFVPTFVSGAGATFVGYVNFGQRPFSYTPPTGYVALNTYNLPTPTILQGNKYMDATIWTGDGSTNRTITNAASFKPDFVWLKERDISIDNILYDSIRGPSTSSASKALSSNQTIAEGSENDNSTYGYLDSFTSSGFTVVRGSNGATSYTNKNTGTYVGWQWQAGQGVTSTNTAGNITSTVDVSTTAGFSIVTYTGNGTAGATVGHGLGVKPSMIIVKNRSGVYAWPVFHTSIDAATGGNGAYLTLSSTSAKTDTTTGDAETVFGNGTQWVTPTSTVFTIGGWAGVNTNTSNYVAYCWAEIAGFSKFGSYTGNYNVDGVFVYCGFRPKFILIKAANNAYDWELIDTGRSTYNGSSNYLQPNLSSAEYSTTSDIMDILSNGFKMRNNWTRLNDTITYIYAAFAENPFKNALAR